MRWIRTLRADTEGTAETLGGKALGLVLLHRLGLPVPAAFVLTTAACRAFPRGLGGELTEAVSWLERETGRTFGGPGRPLAVSVRSGAAVSMPGMMSTVLGLGLTTDATACLADETGDRRFALDARRRFLSSFARAVLDTDATGAVEDLVRQRCGRPIPDDAARQLAWAVEAVLASWDAPRARTYRAVHDLPDGPGTAVIVQAMVYGNRDERSGSGVAFSRDPTTGEPGPYGDVVFGRQGEDVVSGRSATRPLRELAAREPAVWARLLDALRRIEGHYRDACHVEFTFQSGELWLLQVRPDRFTGGAAVRLAVELADERVIDRREAVLRISPRQLLHVGTPRLASPRDADLFARGVGACPGVAVGRVATTAELAVRMAAEAPVVLVRPETSPHDMHGLAAATGIVTARGGPASHAAIVARALGKPAVVGVAGLAVDAGSGTVTAGGRTLADGALVTLDGTTGDVALGTPRVTAGETDAHLHQLLAWADDIAEDHSERAAPQRLEAAHAALRRP
ncbi:pyruvate, phosphate dikinase [Streptomyces avicenniae]|uniref:pyruvate, phosphate dikinase n=1 Tax=Streptomyces avicenniae TaxID=500153 RepID=UPI00069B96EF|nr:pyruvate, phosphate dikinase [Streptomyces avicenniae]